MLHLIYGRSGTGKTSRLISTAGEAAASGLRVLFLVPEQSTVNAERAVTDALGVAATRNIEVLNFRRLCNHVFKQAGGLARRHISDAGRTVLMAAAFDELRPMLPALGSARLTPALIEKLLETDAELKQYRVDGDRLERAVQAIENTRQRQRLSDILHVTQAYNALLHRSFDDALEDMDYCAKLLEDNDIYGGAVLCLDDFTGFTPQQLRVVELLMRSAKDMYVALTADGPADEDGGYGLFSHVKKTAFTLRRIAERQGVSEAPPVILTENLSAHRESLRHLEKNLFAVQKPEFSADDGGIIFYTADDPFDEAEFTAREIYRLLREENLRCRDIVVVARSAGEYADILDAVFRRYGLPLFCDRRVSLMQKPVMLLMLSLLDILCDGFETDTVLRALKTGLWDMDDDSLCALEGYAERWAIRGRRWIDPRPFSEHPRGFEDTWTEDDRAALSLINAARERFAGPMRDLCRKVEQAEDTGGYCRAFYEHLMALRVPEKLEGQAQQFRDMGELSLAQEQAQLWDVLMDAFDQMAQAGQAAKCDLARFRELFRAVLSSFEVGRIPTSLDEVTFGDAQRMRSGVKACVFVLGLSEGMFPAAIRDTRLIGDGDRRALSEADSDLCLAETTEYMVFEEPYFAYSVFTRASQRLYLLCHSTGFDGGKAEPSRLFTDAAAMFPNAPRRSASTEPPLSLIEKPGPAFDRLASGELAKRDPAIAAALRDVFARDKDMARRLSAVEAAGRMGTDERISPETAEGLYGRDISVSPSRLESYAGCQFAYFCRYGLKADEQERATLAANTAGTFLHRALEAVMREAAEDGMIGRMSDADIERRAQTLSREYLVTCLGGEREKSARFLHLYRRLSKSAAVLLKTLNGEFAQSGFKPAGFEVRLAPDGEVPPLRLPLDDGSSIRLFGVADRVDIYDSGKKRYLRVVDYKSGGKIFRLSDCYHGLSVQMLLYLRALCQGGEKRFGKGLVPAGVLYYPARDRYIPAPRGIGEEELSRLRSRAFKQNGLLLDDMEALRAMERALEGRYIPVSLKRDGTPAASSALAQKEELEALLAYCERILADMGKALKRGEVAIAPLKDDAGKVNACRYCKYHPVCGFEPDRLRARRYEPMDKREVLRRVCESRLEDDTQGGQAPEPYAHAAKGGERRG